MSNRLYKDDMNIFEKILSCITFFLDALYRVLIEYSKIVLLVIIVIVSAEVVARKFVGKSIFWADEVSLFLIIWMAFIAMAIGVEKHLHIAIEMFTNKLPKKAQMILDKIICATTFFFGFVLFVYGIRLVSSTMSSTLPATQWPAGLEYLMMPVGGFFIMYFTLIEFFGLQKYRHHDFDLKEDIEARQAAEAAAAEENKTVQEAK